MMMIESKFTFLQENSSNKLVKKKIMNKFPRKKPRINDFNKI